MAINDPVATPLPPHQPLPDYYAAPEQRRGFVRDIFDDTAHWYETIDGALSFGSGNWYRREALKRAGLTKGMKMLDVATGTGVVRRAAAEILGPGSAVGLDPSIGMLLAGRKKTPSPAVQAMGERLPFKTETFDILSIGFALRHLPDLRLGFSEFHRVLRPGGKLLVLEITRPRSAFAASVMRFYMGKIVPAISRFRTGSDDVKKLMEYYWDTIDACVPPESILAAMREAGFSDAERHIEMGMFSEYRGVRKG